MQGAAASVFGALAQLGERMAGSHEVRGSIPLGSTNYSGRCTGLFYFRRLYAFACFAFNVKNISLEMGIARFYFELKESPTSPKALRHQTAGGRVVAPMRRSALML